MILLTAAAAIWTCPRRVPKGAGADVGCAAVRRMVSIADVSGDEDEDDEDEEDDEFRDELEVAVLPSLSIRLCYTMSRTDTYFQLNPPSRSESAICVARTDTYLQPNPPSRQLFGALCLGLIPDQTWLRNVCVWMPGHAWLHNVRDCCPTISCDTASGTNA
eukprot:3676322-Rhodomonas_salina.1